MTDDEREGLALTDDELDRLVAERVCGWQLDEIEERRWLTTDRKHACCTRYWHPSTDLNDAVRAAEEANCGETEFGAGFKLFGGTCSAYAVSGEGMSATIGRARMPRDQATRALCLAMLRAKGVEV